MVFVLDVVGDDCADMARAVAYNSDWVQIESALDALHDAFSHLGHPMSEPVDRSPSSLAPPSAWVVRWSELVPRSGSVLDVACGVGRHALYFANRGHVVKAIDRDIGAVAAIAAQTGIVPVRADIEDAAWPCAGEAFAAVVVTNYLHRPLLPVLVDAVAPGGVLIYETFARGNERFGRPSNPAFLLQPGELLAAVRGRLRVIAYEDVQIDAPKPAMVQRICARREAIDSR
jgi:SAM-dependent methyltransferase